ncbi:MAG: hypothetical protein FWF28_00725 [Micrococcales bacterium]|nr:hypothetical protein [Micrococcales bacterium]
MPGSVEDANRAINAVFRTPYGVARVAMAERMVQRLEIQGPDEARAYAFNALLDSCYWSGEVERSFVVFARALRWLDERPETCDESDRNGLHWAYRWMVQSLAEFPQVPVARIEDTLADMARRYTVQGKGMAAVATERFRWAARRGADDAEALFDQWRHVPRDTFSQCDACEAVDQGEWLVATGRADQALPILRKIDTTTQGCQIGPAAALTQLAELSLDLGQPVEAVRAYRQSLVVLDRAVGDMAATRGRHIRLLARGGCAQRARHAIEADQALLTKASTPGNRLEFLLAVGAATHVLRADGGQEPLALRAVPAATVAQLDDWLRAEASALVMAFDARNGTDRWAKLLDAAWHAEPADSLLELDVLPAAMVEGEAAPSGSAAGGPAGAVGSSAGQQGGSAGQSGSGGSPGGPAAGQPGGSAAVADEGSGGPPAASSSDDALAEAERLARAGDLTQAAGWYVRAARQAEDAGLLVDSGFAWAEAAHAAQVLGDDAGASRSYVQAMSRLWAADASAALVAPVVVAWARAAAVGGYGEQVVVAAQRIVGELGSSGEPVARRATADVLDAQARLVGSREDGEGAALEAVALAERAAELYAGLGAGSDAAHARWLTGRLHDRLGMPDDAVDDFQAAMAGFATARQPTERGHVIDDLIALLRRTGQDARADQIVADEMAAQAAPPAAPPAPAVPAVPAAPPVPPVSGATPAVPEMSAASAAGSAGPTAVRAVASGAVPPAAVGALAPGATASVPVGGVPGSSAVPGVSAVGVPSVGSSSGTTPPGISSSGISMKTEPPVHAVRYGPRPARNAPPSAWSVVAMVTGLVGVFLSGVFNGIPAVVIGIWAIVVGIRSGKGASRRSNTWNFAVCGTLLGVLALVMAFAALLRGARAG